MERNLSYVNPYGKNLWFSMGSSCLLMFSRTVVVGCAILADIRGVHRNFEKGFPLQLSDCYIRIVYIV